MDTSGLSNATTLDEMKTAAGDYWTALNTPCGGDCTAGDTAVKDAAITTMESEYVEGAATEDMTTVFTKATTAMAEGYKDHFR